MDLDTFWKLIASARRAAGVSYKTPDGPYLVAPALVEKLKQLPEDEIIAFQQIRWDLWAVAYIVNGGCSDDGFDYFRGWLLGNGRTRWEAVMETPEMIGRWVRPDEAYCEAMLSCASKAYEAKKGEPIPHCRIKYKRPSRPAGKRWKYEELETLYPRLYKKFLNDDED